MQKLNHIASSGGKSCRIESYLATSPDDRFSRDEAQIMLGHSYTMMQYNHCEYFKKRSVFISKLLQ